MWISHYKHPETLRLYLLSGSSKLILPSNKMKGCLSFALVWQKKNLLLFIPWFMQCCYFWNNAKWLKASWEYHVIEWLESTIVTVILKLLICWWNDCDWDQKMTRKALGWNKQSCQSSNGTRKSEKKVKVGVLLKVKRLISLQTFIKKFSVA